MHYGRHERVWSGRANPVLVDVAASLSADSVLDLGCAEGGDAVWLAGLGWRVTAVDVSATALERALAHAISAGVQDLIDFQRHDLARTLSHRAVRLCLSPVPGLAGGLPPGPCPAGRCPCRGPGRPAAGRHARLGGTVVMGRPQHPLPHPAGSPGCARAGPRAVAHRRAGRTPTRGHRPERGVRHRHPTPSSPSGAAPRSDSVARAEPLQGQRYWDITAQMLAFGGLPLLRGHITDYI